MMIKRTCRSAAMVVLLCALPVVAQAYSAKPDLTAAGAIATLKTDANSSPLYRESYNLGPTGLRGWMYRDPNNMGQEGLQTAQDRQILVTAVGSGTPASGVLAVDDVILGVKAGSGTVPAFTGDCRKTFGAAIGDAEATANGGVLRLLCWRAGTTSEVQITLPANVTGSYSDTAPYDCPKSALILANAITKLNQESLSNGWTGACSGLALLAAVKPGDANYSAVQTKLQNLAHTLAPANLTLTGCNTWGWGYVGVFLSEYYLRTVADGSPDASVLHGINEYTVGLAKGQSKYGTFGHGGAEKHADGSLHGSISWYGPVNSAGLIGNLAIVLGKKALVAGGIAPDPEIDPAIERGSKFFAYFVNKGGVPYGEHEPWSGGHASNGKDAMAAVFFALQDDKPVEAEYYTRMSTAGWVGREYGHTGQGFSYLWSALGAAMGGDAAAAAHLKQVRWHLDLERRTDGSFVYDGGEQYGGSSTSGYFGSSSYSGLSPTACFVLTYALPLKRLYITGRNANPANTLDAAKVANEIAAATYERDCPAYPVATLIAALGEYDPVVRHDAAAELAKRTLTTAELNSLIALITNGTLSPDANVRQGACESLGIRKTTAALTALGQRLSDTDLWVRGKAANALKNFGSAASPQLTPMLTAFAANATDPDVIVWDDPIQIANGYLADTLFQALAASTIAASKSLLYPAVLAGLKQPDGMARMYLGNFIKNRLTLADVQAVAPGIVDAVAERSPADRMFSDVIRYAGLNALAKYKIEEGIPLCLIVKEQTWHGDDWDPFTILQNTYRGAAKDALPTLYKWQAHIPQFAADGSIGGCCPTRLTNITDKIASTIAAIENDAAPPALTYFKTLTASASPATATLPAASVTLSAVMTDLDGGLPNFVWSKVSGPGVVSFNPGGTSASATCTAVFGAPGTYQLRVTAVDRSILDDNKWITYSLGYYDFETYNETLAAVTKEVTVTVTPDPNRAPVAQNQSVSTPANTGAPITLAATDPNGDTLAYAVATPPAHGTLSGTPPNLVYTPASGFTGPDSFTFKANDGKVDSAVATVTVDVGVVGNRRPVALNQWLTCAEDTAKAITLTGTDPDSDTLVYQIVSGPAHGTLSGTAPNLTYQPAANYPAGNLNGSDSFTFTVRDAALTSAVATVSIALTPVNDPPQALAQSMSVSAISANPVTLAGIDPEGYALTYAVVSNPGHGTLSGTAPNLSYRPAANYRGADSFAFRVTDSAGMVSPAATVSITIINDPPVAKPQYVELPPNTATAITLTGSDNAGDPLTYAVLTQPAHGVLSGTAPNLTYTPVADFAGLDSFTFKVNDGVSDSPDAVVTLAVAQWQTWTNIAAGTWSTGGNWSGGVAPAAGGSANNLLVFNTNPYSGSSSNDLAGTFQLNRMNCGSALPALIVSGNALSFTANGAALPQLNQNSANTVTISSNIALVSNTTLGGTGAGALTLSGIISGAGGLTKTSSGVLTLSGANAHIGGTTIKNGTITLGNRVGFGTGAATMAGGTTYLQSNFEGNSAGGALPNALVLSGGQVAFNVAFGSSKDIWINTQVSGPGGIVVVGGGRSQGLTLQGNNTFQGGVTLGTPGSADGTNVQLFNVNSLGTGTLRTELTGTDLGSGGLRIQADLSAGVPNPVYLVSGARMVVNTSPDGTARSVLFTGPVTGGGSLVKAGTGTMTLSGTNTYVGATKVLTGTLACSSASSLGQGPLAISSGGAKVTLNFTGTRQVTSLSLGGVQQANGSYGSSTSPAANKNNTYFSGAGTVTVIPATSTALVLTEGVTPSMPGDPLAFTATVTGSTPTGNVAFYAGATLLGTSALNASSQASVTTSSLAPGSYNLSAQYAGDANNGASTSAALAIHIGVPAVPANLVATPGTNAVGLTWAAASGAIGYNVKRAAVSGGPYATRATLSGTSFNDTPATHGATCYYVVSAINNAGEGADSSQASATPVAVPSSTRLVLSPLATGPYGGAVTFSATVTAAATGTVTFKDGTTVLGTGTLVAGVATYATSTLAIGGHTITASYGGDAVYASSASGALGYSVTAKPVTITGMTAANKVYDGATTAVLTGGTVAGAVVGETVTVTAGTGTFASANVGSQAVTATGCALGGPNAGNYVLAAQPAVANASITPRPVRLAGARVYDGTPAASADILSVSNNLDGANLTLTGSASLAGRNAGSQAIVMPPARVRSATGNTGSGTAATIAVTLDAAPADGNTLVAVIATRGTSSGRVASITQTGAVWTRAAQAANANGTTTEIWYASNISGAAATVTINQASLRSAAVVIEYSGLLSASPVDKTANATGNTAAASTGLTTTTSQLNELWIGGIGLVNSDYDLGTPTNSFVSVASAQSTNTTAANNAKVCALELLSAATGTAGSGGTITSSQWSGAIVTFKASAATSTLALAGTAAGNYTLAGATGSVAISPLPLTVAAVTATKTYDGTTSAAGTPSLMPPLAAGDATMALWQAYQDANAGTGNKVIIPNISIDDGNGGANYAPTLANCTTGTITKAPATVTLGNLTHNYDGTPKAATATTDPVGLTVTFTYGGSVVAPSVPGSYAVVGTVSAMNHAGTAGGTLVIIAEPIVLWRDAHFTAAEITAGLAADAVDADGDGFTNLVEYTLGTDPLGSSSQPLAVAPATDNHFTLSFVARRAAGAGYANLTRKYTVEASSDIADPASWQPVAGYTNIIGDDQAVTATLPAAPAGRFYRLNVRVE